MNNKIFVNKTDIRCLFVIIFPIIPWYFSVLGISGIHLFSIIALFLFFCFGGISGKGRVRINAVLIIGLIWLLSICLCDVMNAEAKNAVFLLLRVITVYMCVGTIKDRETFLKVLSALVYMFGIVAIFGCIEAITGFNVFSLLNTVGARMNYNPARFGLQRILTFGAHSIVHGLYVAFGMALCLYLIQFYKRENIKRTILFVIYGLLWLNEIFTLSRSSILCAIVCNALLLYFMGAKKIIVTIIRILAIGLLVYFLVNLVAPQLAALIKNVYYMMLAVLNDNYRELIRYSFGDDNLNAYGNRVDLYKWVVDSMGDRWAFGHGINSKFDYAYQDTDGIWIWTAHKIHIEVEYLSLLYYYGLVGLISTVAFYLSLLVNAIRRSKIRGAGEEQLGFNQICIAIFITYYFGLFMVNSSSEINCFYVIVALFLAYNLNYCFRNDGNEFYPLIRRWE